ncbi:hypothetical protein [uncultured Helicobacter sp.]|uniref:hypothetical protein n=1 Tax=uncultured Helicobacter sp. TaxID=175537 RepID=UPI00374F9D8B
MEVLTLTDSPALANSKKLIKRGIIGFIISFFACLVPLVNLIAIFTLVAFWIVGLVGLYRFSKLANTFVFRYYIYAVLLNIGYYIALQILVYGFVGINDVMMLSTSVYVVSAIILLGSIAVVALQIYWFYKVSVEMAFLTGLKAFMVSFRLYIIAFVGNVLVAAVFGFMFVDFLNHNPFLVSTAMFNGIETLFVAFFEKNLMMLLVWILFVVIALVSIVFLFIGLLGFQQTYVRPQSTLESQDS